MDHQLSYTVVVATRNRTRELAVSLPLYCHQTRPPAEVIIVDSSDDPEGVSSIAQHAFAGHAVAYRVIRSSPGGALQRNIGLDNTRTPIVMLPDDDVLWYPDVGEACLKVFEADKDDQVKGVVAAEVDIPPAGVMPINRGGTSYRKSKMRGGLRSLKFKLEQLFAPNPFKLHGRALSQLHPMPEAVQRMGAKTVEWASLGRMAARTDVMKRLLVHEFLGTYPLYEDVDLSWRMMNQGLLVAAPGAKIFHDENPGLRRGYFEMGVIGVLNLAYVVCAHAEPGSMARRAIPRYSLIKAAKYWVGSRDANARLRASGARRAHEVLVELLEAPRDQAKSRYLALRERILRPQ